MIHLLLATTATLLLLSSLPLLVELCLLSLSALFLHELANSPATGVAPARLAVVVPAHDEEQLIRACVASLRNSHRPPDAIYVVAHNCKDTTAAAAESAGAQVLVLHDDGSRGKGAALDHGFTHALAQHHTAILVVDADSVVDPTLTGHVTRAFADGADAVQARYIASTTVAGTRTAIMALSLTGMNFVRPRGRSRLGLSSGIFGNGFALSAATIGAVPYTAHSVVEDLEYHLSLVASGRSVRFLEYAIVRGELPDNDKAAGTQRARWEGGRARIRRDFVPRVFRAVLRGNLRLLEPLLDLLSIPIASVVPILLAMAILPLAWSRIYACAGLATLALYVAASVALSPSPSAASRALLSVPGYLLFKLRLIRAKHQASGGHATWVRTARNPTDPGSPSSSPEQPQEQHPR